MNEVVVVGSGASAVHFAQGALERGLRVVMLDVGREAPAPGAPEASFVDLVRGEAATDRAFYGDELSGVSFPGDRDELRGLAPHRKHIFEDHPGRRVDAVGFEPLVSFARGGLAEAWAGGSFPFSDGELEDFPFGYAELEPFYARVAERIGVTGVEDDLTPAMPLHAHLDPPLDLDAHSAALLERYQGLGADWAHRGLRLGRSRMAVLGRDRGERLACTHLGRCRWGCPRGALYTPRLGLEALLSHPRFEYRPDHFVTHFEFDPNGRIDQVVARDRSGQEVVVPLERLVLGAGTLESARIFLRSVFLLRKERWRLEGLMDSRQVYVPFVNLRRLGAAAETEAYQYPHLALSVAHPKEPKWSVHGVVQTLRSTLLHPIVQRVPLDTRTSIALVRHVHGALGQVELSFWDDRRPNNTLQLDEDGETLLVRYHPPRDERRRQRAGIRATRRALRALGCFVPPGLIRSRPMGSSGGYAGGLPMTPQGGPRTTDPTGRSRDFENLWLVDGITFPFLPGKPPTFTLMANAARIAEQL